jgi:tagatose 6-phosphate kinase
VDILAADAQDGAMILCIGATPAAQRVMVFKSLKVDAVNRTADVLDGIAGKSINVAKVLKALGLNPLAVGFIGGQRGEELQSLLAKRGVSTDFVTVNATTRQCTTVIDEATSTYTELVEESREVSPADYERLAGIVGARLGQCRAAVVSGSLTPGGPSGFFRDCARMAAEAGVFSLIDAQGAALLSALPAGPGLVKPNRSELARTLGCALNDEEDSLRAMRKLWELGAQRVVITAGKEPALAFDGKNFWRIRSPMVKAVNPIGSGDAFAAGLAWRLLRGDGLGEACRWGCATGAANTLSLMPGELELEQVERLVASVRLERLPE